MSSVARWLVLATLALFRPVEAAEQAQVPGERPRLLVLQLASQSDADAVTVRSFDELLSLEAGRPGLYRVVSANEMQTLLGLERQKELLGCSEDSAACMSEIADAIGARFVLSGTLARLGESWQLNLQMLDSRTAQTVGRTTRIAGDLPVLRRMVPYAVAEAMGMPAPPSPSRAGPIALIAAGAAAAVGGGLLGAVTLGEDAQLTRELELGETRGARLDSAAAYQDRANSIGQRKTLSLGAVAAGAALVAAGILLMPEDLSGGGVAVLPSSRGVALVGVFP